MSNAPTHQDVARAWRAVDAIASDFPHQTPAQRRISRRRCDTATTHARAVQAAFQAAGGVWRPSPGGIGAMGR